MGRLVCSDHETVEFEILRAAKRAHSKLTTLEFRRADFGLLRDLLVEYHGIKPWRGFPGEKRGPRKLVNIQGSPHPSSEMMHPKEEEVRQKCQETCRCDRGAPGQVQTHKGSLQRVETGTRWPGRNQKNCPSSHGSV